MCVCHMDVYDECVGIIMGMTRGCTRTFPFSNTLCALKSLLEDDQQMSGNITTHAQLIFYYYFGGKCVYVVDELVGWRVRRLMDHVSCGHRRAHRCQSIILSAASDLKWPFNHFVWPDCIDHCSNELGVVSSAHQFTVIILFRTSQMVKRSTISHSRVHLLNFPAYETAGVAQQSPQVACFERLRKARSLKSFPFTRSPSIQGLQPSPVGAVATELPTHSNSAARDKPAPRARTCRTWVNKRIRAKPVNCGQ